MKREAWIDIMKGIAISAIVFDHVFYIFPQIQNHYIWQHTFFAVPWFVFLTAVTNTMSTRRKKWVIPSSLIFYWIGRIRVVLLPYIFVSVFIYLFYNLNTAQLAEMVDQLVNFSAQPTYYFINLLFRLYFIFPFLYILAQIIKKKWLFLPFTLGVYAVSFDFFNIKSQLPLPFYSSSNLGDYFFLFFLGILYGNKVWRENKLLYLLLMLAFVVYEFLMNTSRVFFLRSISINLFIWSMALFFFVKKGIEIFSRPKILIYTLAVLGRYSLFIYLVHYFFLEQVAKYITITNVTWPILLPTLPRLL